MGLLDNNYSEKLTQEVEHKANLLAQAELAVYGVKQKFEMACNDPRCKPRRGFNFGAHRNYTIVIKYIDNKKKQQAIAYQYRIPAEGYSNSHWEISIKKLQYKALELEENKGYCVTSIYTK